MIKGGFGPNPYIKDSGIKIIEKIYFEGDTPENVLDTLYELLPDQDITLQRVIIKALGRIGNKETVKFLKEFQKSKKDDQLISDIVAAVDHIERKHS